MKKEEILRRLRDRNCGMCGFGSCARFAEEAEKNPSLLERCMYLGEGYEVRDVTCAEYTGKDVIGEKYDFILMPLPNEKSCREYILPFNPLLIRELDIKRGDIVVGRPMGQGCPVQHVLEVVEVDKFCVITAWVVGPQYSRSRDFKEIGPYRLVAFEGLAKVVSREPMFGHRQRFLPGYCMMNLTHTGLVNFVNKTKRGIHVRLEDIIIGV
ncbi:MAG: hypothetical protein QXK94_09635 [Candidatus Jordarchaeales archaeon]